MRELIDAIATARVPCMSIMNMPPLPYLERLPSVSADECRHCYTEPEVWDRFDPALLTLCRFPRSPGRPASRGGPEEMRVTLPTNFKAARFESDAHTAMLRDLSSSIDAVRYDSGEGEVELPVKLRVHDSVMVPMAKWAMLMAGNYRCILPGRHAVRPGRRPRGPRRQPGHLRVGVRRVQGAGRPPTRTWSPLRSTPTRPRA